MISEFQQLANKVEQMVTLVQSLRDTNADLQRKIAELTDTNTELTERIQEAHDRVSVVLNHPSFTEQESE